MSKKIVIPKDKHKGNKAFIVATGPSLRISDLELIKNIYLFLAIRYILLLIKQTGVLIIILL